VLLMAHLDGLGAHGDDADKIHNGAMDNATGPPSRPCWKLPGR
jgi:hypothetical protein